MERIYSAALEVLEKTGVDVCEGESAELLKSAGASACGQMRVRIPGHVVERAIESAPRKIKLYDKDGNCSLILGKKDVYFGVGTDCANIMDIYTKEKRPVRQEDILKGAIVADRLENIDFFVSVGGLSDVSKIADNTRKPLLFTVDDADVLSDVTGGRRVILFAEPASPFVHTQKGLEKVLWAAGNDVPMVYASSPICGSNAPVTLAGTLTVALVECLSGLVISQLKREGSPFIIGILPSVMDMSSCLLCYWGPEPLLLSAGFVQMAKRLDLPVLVSAGGSDSSALDERTILEFWSSCLWAGLSGADMVCCTPVLESGLTGSLELIALADEIASFTRRMRKGIDVEKISLDVMDAVAPGGDFLASDHTAENFKDELWLSDFMMDRGTSLLEKSRERAKALLGDREKQ